MSSSPLGMSTAEVLRWWGITEGGGDPITSKWFGVNTVYYPLSVIFIYVGLLSIYYKKHDDKKPSSISLTYILRFYNLFQVCVSFYVFKETLLTAVSAKYNLWCQPMESTLSGNGRRMALASYYFHLLKYLDLLDTAFMVIKGNFRQVTPLHVFHHSTMLLNSWFGIRHVPTGHSFIVHMANSFVHVCMYSYYFLSSFGAWIRPYLWWKSYLTVLQIFHFFLMGAHQALGYINNCPISVGLAFLVIFYDLVLIMLFSDFYIKAYRKRSKSSQNGTNGTTATNAKLKES